MPRPDANEMSTDHIGGKSVSKVRKSPEYSGCILFPVPAVRGPGVIALLNYEKGGKTNPWLRLVLTGAGIGFLSAQFTPLDLVRGELLDMRIRHAHTACAQLAVISAPSCWKRKFFCLPFCMFFTSSEGEDEVSGRAGEGRWWREGKVEK